MKKDITILSSRKIILKRRSDMNNTWWFMIGNYLCIDETFLKAVKRMFIGIT